MVIEVAEQFVEVGKAMAEHLAMLQRTVDRLGGGKAVDYAAVEAAIAEGASRTELAAHRAILKSLDMDVPAVVIGGVRYTRVGRCEGAYHTMVGSVSVERSLYRQSGQRGGQPGGRVVDAVSLRAGVVGDGWLPQTARAMSYAVQQGTSREAEKTAQEFRRLPYSRASFERVTHVVGALAVADHQDIEDALIDAVEVPGEATSVSVSLDRVSVPMEEPRPRPVGRPKKGAAKRPVERNFRMAYCGTVTLHDKTGAGRYTIRYGCMPQGDIVGLRDRMVCGDAAEQAAGPENRAAVRRGPGDVESAGGRLHAKIRKRPRAFCRFLSHDGKAQRCSACAGGLGGCGRRTAGRLEASPTPPQQRSSRHSQGTDRFGAR